MNQTKTGFTLAELIAVVIIVSLMATFAVGYYRRSVEQARFHEGVTVGTAYAEAINRRNLEKQLNGGSGNNVAYKVKTLDIGLNSCEDNEYCAQTKYFKIYAPQTYATYLYGERLDGPYKGGVYRLQFNTDNTSGGTTVKCIGVSPNQNRGKAFCESMGYTACSGNTCQKP